MKLLFVTLALVASVAHAAPRAVSLSCDARELVPGGEGRTGQLVILASTDDKFLHSPWAINVSWKGSPAIVAPGTVCGAAISQKCFETVQGSGGLFHFSQACGIDGFDTSGLPHHASDVSLSLASVDGVAHGRFYCAARGVSYANVELSNCR